MFEALAPHVLLNSSSLDRMDLQVRARVYIVMPMSRWPTQPTRCLRGPFTAGATGVGQLTRPNGKTRAFLAKVQASWDLLTIGGEIATSNSFTEFTAAVSVAKPPISEACNYDRRKALDGFLWLT